MFTPMRPSVQLSIGAGPSRAHHASRPRAGVLARRPSGRVTHPVRAVATHLLRERADLDRLLDLPGEAGLFEPRAVSSSRSALIATTGIRAVRSSCPERLRATSAPCMSGSRRSSRITSGIVLGRECDAFRGVRRIHRPESGGAQARPGRASGSCRCRRRSARVVMGVSSRRADPARDRRGPLPRSRGRAAACSTRSRTSRSRRCAAISTRCLPPWMRSGRTSSSRTSACPQQHRRGDPGRRAAA